MVSLQPPRGVFTTSIPPILANEFRFRGPLCGGLPLVTPWNQAGHVCPPAQVQAQEARYAASTKICSRSFWEEDWYLSRPGGDPSLSGEKAKGEVSKDSQELFPVT